LASVLPGEKRKKSSDNAATNENLGASVIRGHVAWHDLVENDEQRGTAMGNWRQSPEARKAKKSSNDLAKDKDPDASVPKR